MTITCMRRKAAAPLDMGVKPPQRGRLAAVRLNAVGAPATVRLLICDCSRFMHPADQRARTILTASAHGRQALPASSNNRRARGGAGANSPSIVLRRRRHQPPATSVRAHHQRRSPAGDEHHRRGRRAGRNHLLLVSVSVRELACGTIANRIRSRCLTPRMVQSRYRRAQGSHHEDGTWRGRQDSACPLARSWQ